MASRAEQFRAKVERSGKKKAKAPKRPRRDVPVDTAQPGTSASDRKAGNGDSGARNRSSRAAKKGGAALESSRGKPSRKSTRRSKGRAKRTSNLKRRATRATGSSKARASKARAKRS